MRCDFVFPKEDYLLIGTVGKPHGLRGEVHIFPLSGHPETLAQYSRVTLVDGRGTLSPQLTVTSFRVHGGKAIVGFDRVVDRSFAEKLSGMGVLIAREDLPAPGLDEFYWHELQGATVTTVAGDQLGILQGVFSNGAQDVMVVVDGQAEYMIPVSPGIIVSQDSSSLVLDPPPGLLAINGGDDDD